MTSIPPRVTFSHTLNKDDKFKGYDVIVPRDLLEYAISIGNIPERAPLLSRVHIISSRRQPPDAIAFTVEYHAGDNSACGNTVWHSYAKPGNLGPRTTFMAITTAPCVVRGCANQSLFCFPRNSNDRGFVKNCGSHTCDSVHIMLRDDYDALVERIDQLRHSIRELSNS